MDFKKNYEKLMGKYEYYFKPKYKKCFGGVFNGQIIRRKIYSDLLASFNFNYLVETGTYRANTTMFLAESTLPVYTVESNDRFYSYAETRTKKINNIYLYQNDSRVFLRDLSSNNNLLHENVFFYLDAHGWENQPLNEEILIIFKNWQNSVVMVDDFKVPETDYAFDDYGENKTLDLNFIGKTILTLNLKVYFPKEGPEKETGFKRGCVILAQGRDSVEKLERIKSIYSYN
jgi:hypothetical protein